MPSRRFRDTGHFGAIRGTAPLRRIPRRDRVPDPAPVAEGSRKLAIQASEHARRPATHGRFDPTAQTDRRLTKLPIRDLDETQALAKSVYQPVSPIRPEHGTTQRTDPIWPNRQGSRNRYRPLRYTSTPNSTKGDQGEGLAINGGVHCLRTNPQVMLFSLELEPNPIRRYDA